MKTITKIAATALMALTIGANIAIAQNIAAPDRKSIETTVTRTPDQYQALHDRFVQGDATLTPAEVATVYYGYRHNPGFRANAAYPALMDAFEKHDYTRALDMARMALTGNPVSLPLLFKAYACAAASPEESAKAKAKVYQTRINQICDVIFHSGKGVSTYNPYYVLREGDIEPFVKNYLQPDSVIDSSTVGNSKAVKMKFNGIPDEVILYFTTY